MATVFQEMISSGDVVPVPICLDLYHAMIESAEFPETSGVELIDGTVLRKDRRDSPEDSIMTHGPRHSSVLHTLLAQLASFATQHGSYVLVQSPITLPPMSEPEPDLAVVHGTPRDYLDVHPTVANIALVIEVSLSSLRADRSSKRLLYGASGVVEYWIVDVDARAVEVHRDPSPNGYESIRRFTELESVTLDLSGHQLTLPLADFLFL